MAEQKSFLVDFVVPLTGMATFFGSALTLHLFISVKILSFTDLRMWIRVPGLDVFFGTAGCLLWHVQVETLLGLTLLEILAFIVLSVLCVPIRMGFVVSGELVTSFFSELVDSRISDDLGVWNVADDLSGFGAGGCGVFAHLSGSGWFQRRWWHLDLLPADGGLSVERCTFFDSVPGPLKSVQRAEMWGVVLALQSSSAVHLGVDNLTVICHVSGILAGRSGRGPFELCTDGGLFTFNGGSHSSKGF